MGFEDKDVKIMENSGVLEILFTVERTVDRDVQYLDGTTHVLLCIYTTRNINLVSVPPELTIG